MSWSEADVERELRSMEAARKLNETPSCICSAVGGHRRCPSCTEAHRESRPLSPTSRGALLLPIEIRGEMWVTGLGQMGITAHRAASTWSCG